ncbi:MAG: flagellar basal body P-ring formation chaperone FlgA [Roseovarius sp.]
MTAALVALPAAAAADMVVATRTIRALTTIAAEDVAVQDGAAPGVAARPAEVIGQEARVAIYAGRPVVLADIGPPAVIERNQIVPLVFDRGTLRIVTEGRSLSRAAVGEQVRVMNLSSRSTVSGRVGEDGRVHVSP